MSIFKEFGSAAKSNAAPATTGLVVAMVVSFVYSWMSHGQPYPQLAFVSQGASQHPWTLITYPFAFAPNDFLSALFGCMWLWGIGGAVERDLGSTKYLGVWALFSVLCACFVWLGSIILSSNEALMAGPWNILAAVTVLWATRNPNIQLLFMFVIPMQAKWLAWLSVGLVFFSTHPPEVAPFGAIPYILAYMYASNRIPFALYSRSDLRYRGPQKKWERYDKSYYEEVQRREKDRDERERLRKLFEGSIKDDDDQKG